MIAVFHGDDPEFKRQKASIAKLEKTEKEISKSPTTMVMAERVQPRESYIFIKADFTRHGDVVTAGVPKVLPPLTKAGTPTRLDLAEWIVDPKNPLTARVEMNRVWQEYFGKGIVETENDFGTRKGRLRLTNPELLDWLATEFVRQHWV